MSVVFEFLEYFIFTSMIWQDSIWYRPGWGLDEVITNSDVKFMKASKPSMQRPVHHNTLVTLKATYFIAIFNNIAMKSFYESTRF